MRKEIILPRYEWKYKGFYIYRKVSIGLFPSEHHFEVVSNLSGIKEFFPTLKKAKEYIDKMLVGEDNSMGGVF